MTFGGSGNTLSGRQLQPAASSSKGKGKEKVAAEEVKEEARWGTGGHTLGSRATVPSTFRAHDVGAGAAPVPLPRRKGKEKLKAKAKSPSPERDWGVDDDDVIVIDSD